jgi:beta-N-acetylhexosaminidase
MVRGVSKRMIAIGVVLAGLASACGPARPPVASPPTSAAPTAMQAPTPSPTVTTSEDSCVAATMATMTLRQRVGQVMLVGTPVANPAGAAAIVSSYGLGGVFLAGRSQASATTLRDAIAGLQKSAPAGVGLLVALDQEGGNVQTLQGPDFPPIPTALAQGRLGQQDLRTSTQAWATRLAGIGVNLDLAPVADTVPASLGAGNPPIGAFARQYGSDPDAVAQSIATVVPAIQSAGVLTTLKHFPGLGRVTSNTDTSAAAVDSVATTKDPYLAPFAAGIQAGTHAVMVSLASYPKLDQQAIAAFSSAVINGLLRGQLGFAGMVVSDDLGQAVAVRDVPVGQRAVKFIDAGGDLALTVTASSAPAMFDGLLAAANGSSAFTAKVTEAATRVVRAKYAAGLLSCSPLRQ